MCTHAPTAVAQPAKPPSGKSCDCAVGSNFAGDSGPDRVFFSPFREVCEFGAWVSSLSLALISDVERVVLMCPDSLGSRIEETHFSARLAGIREIREMVRTLCRPDFWSRLSCARSHEGPLPPSRRPGRRSTPISLDLAKTLNLFDWRYPTEFIKTMYS